MKTLFREAYGQLVPEMREQVFDIIFFGSAWRGNDEARDYDACVVLKRKGDATEILKKFASEKVHLSSLSLEEIFTAPLWVTLLLEGESLLQGKRISEMYNFASGIIFSYKLRSLGPGEKVKFSHALFGRDGKGLAYEIGAESLGRGSILVPRATSEEFRKFLETWKVDYSAKDCLVFK